MPLVIDCVCGKKLKVRDELAGKKVKCPGCGKAVAAPAPEPMEVEPVADVMAGEPPVAHSSRNEESDAKSTNVSAEPAPIWTAKKKSASTERDDVDAEPDADADDEIEKPAPHWVFPGALSTEVMVLAGEGPWFASLKGDALKKAKRLLKAGEAPAEVLGEKAYYIPWALIKSIYCNRKLNGLTINYTNDGEFASKVLSPSDREERDEILKAIEKLLRPDWERTVKKHTPITAMVLPITAIAITGAITIGLAILSVFIAGDWEGRGRGALVALIFNILSWLGPIGTCGVGILVGACMMPWMLVRVMNPPIEVTLAPVPPERRVEEED